MAGIRNRAWGRTTGALPQPQRVPYTAAVARSTSRLRSVSRRPRTMTTAQARSWPEAVAVETGTSGPSKRSSPAVKARFTRRYPRATLHALEAPNATRKRRRSAREEANVRTLRYALREGSGMLRLSALSRLTSVLTSPKVSILLATASVLPAASSSRMVDLTALCAISMASRG